ncbi:MAG: DNA-directed RNA polymerase subunit beta [Bifidobacteriaceae bacterium]|jgi:DNA-directed RNA polymerase subunit beta|nr:DNA-directed RNA polymerase subunit beta [Bifidobacteriaceae bacterium]
MATEKGNVDGKTTSKKSSKIDQTVAITTKSKSGVLKTESSAKVAEAAAEKSAKTNSQTKNLGEPNRISFSRITTPIDVPYLLEIQKDSFDWLIGAKDWQERKRKAIENDDFMFDRKSGLEHLFDEISPIEDDKKSMALTFSKPHIDSPAYTPWECKRNDITYAGPLYVTALYEHYETGQKIRQTVSLGDFPLMTDSGTFVVNGTERVVISQISRSPGIYFTKEVEKQSFREIVNCRIIPQRGSWLEFEIDRRENISVRIDRRRKQSAIIFLKAIGVTEETMDKAFEGYPLLQNALESHRGSDEEEALRDLYAKVRPGEVASAEAGRTMLANFYFNDRRYDLSRIGRYKLNRKLGNHVEINQKLLQPEDLLQTLRYMTALHMGDTEIHPVAQALDPGVGSKKNTALSIYQDDIDHFGNRRVRQVGELVQNIMRAGLLRVARTVQERMTTLDLKEIAPQSLINVRPLTSQLKEFYGQSQLSQFMDQNNPLAALGHRRRLSALGPGGLQRERAAMEVRDVHASHYGRLCPIESPEGQNIGLIGYLASFARINGFGFIETPYRKVVKGRITNEIVYLTADEEVNYIIAQANQKITADNRFADEYVLVRNKMGEADDAHAESVDFMDISPRQMVSIGTSLIPFLEHDDANRALMGANMQRQAVPLVKAEAPYVGTGVEFRAAKDTGDVLMADKPGTVVEVDARIIKVANDDGSTSEYRLRKFERTNQTTCFNQLPIVEVGDKVRQFDTLADSSSTKNGELALGTNLLVAFMNWDGFNFEDAIIISDRLVKEDTLSSILIEEHECTARTTKLGDEEITRDIPNASQEALAELDIDGIIRIGAEVKSGDVLVGKVTPKGETELTPEEKILRSIFADKSKEVRDTSLRMPNGESGTVVDVHVIDRKDGFDLADKVNRIVRVYVAQKRKITSGDKLSGRHGNKGVISKILPIEDMPYLEDGTPVDIVMNPLGVPSRMNLGQVLEIHLGWAAKQGWDINRAKKSEQLKALLPEVTYQVPPNSLVATSVFDGCPGQAISGILESTLEDHNGNRLVDKDGKAVIYDGRTGEKIPQKIGVGYMYIIKLHHLVEDKMHARSTGPYSIITAQPLGGKAQFGGQRFGEMEVWALEAYGAAHTLNEMMTVKSDDIAGREQVYGAIVNGQNIPASGMPESFKVLYKELQSMGLDINPLDKSGNPVPIQEDPKVGDLKNYSELGIDLSAKPLSVRLAEDLEVRK